MLLVLPRVAVVGHDDSDPLGRGALERVDHEQVLHDPLIDRSGMALQDEGVRAAHRLLVAHIHLAVGELVRRRRHQVRPELIGPLFGELAVGPTGEDHQVLLGRALEAVHAVGFPSGTMTKSSGTIGESSQAAASAATAASAEAVPARLSCTQPNRLRWGATLMASAPGGTSWRTTVPAPV